MPGPTEEEYTKNTDSLQFCVEVSWPAASRWMTHLERPLGRGYAGPRHWMGSLIEEGRDVSGQMYRRNRYYDPQTGKFTQEDPIGLAGGLNAYGFAEGDPVTYGDPYGLAACPNAPEGDPRREDASWSDCTREELLAAQGAVNEPLLLDPLNFLPTGRVGSLFSAGWRGILRIGARLLGREATDAGMQFGTKAAARQFLTGMALPELQESAVRSSINRATSTSTISIARGRGGSIIVGISRPGRDGYQLVESTIAQDGTKKVVQKAFNAAGRLVHNDPKT